MFNFIKNIKNRFVTNKEDNNYQGKIFSNFNPASMFKNNTFEDVEVASRCLLRDILKEKNMSKKINLIVSLMTKNKSCGFNIPHKYFSALLSDLKNKGVEVPLGVLIVYNKSQDLGFSREEIAKYVNGFNYEKKFKYEYGNFYYIKDYVVVGMLQNSFDFTAEMLFGFINKSSFLSKDIYYRGLNDILDYNNKVDLLIDFYNSENNKQTPLLTKEEFIVLFKKVNLASEKLDSLNKEKIKIILSYNLIEVVSPLKDNKRTVGVLKI